MLATLAALTVGAAAGAGTGAVQTGSAHQAEAQTGATHKQREGRKASIRGLQQHDTCRKDWRHKQPRGRQRNHARAFEVVRQSRRRGGLQAPAQNHVLGCASKGSVLGGLNGQGAGGSAARTQARTSC